MPHSWRRHDMSGRQAHEERVLSDSIGPQAGWPTSRCQGLRLWPSAVEQAGSLSFTLGNGTDAWHARQAHEDRELTGQERSASAPGITVHIQYRSSGVWGAGLASGRQCLRQDRRPGSDIEGLMGLMCEYRSKHLDTYHSQLEVTGGGQVLRAWMGPIRPICGVHPRHFDACPLLDLKLILCHKIHCYKSDTRSLLLQRIIPQRHWQSKLSEQRNCMHPQRQGLPHDVFVCLTCLTLFCVSNTVLYLGSTCVARCFCVSQ